MIADIVPNVRGRFIDALKANQSAFGFELAVPVLEKLADFFDLVAEHNPILHLTAPASPEEFAVRHILESLTLLEHLPAGALAADIGTGAGLPSLPCLLVRDDLQAVLVESKEKKAAYLAAALERLALTDRAVVINKQFSETRPGGDVGFVTCRALDKFSERLDSLVKWSGQRTMLLFGGPALGDQLEKLPVSITRRRLMPFSEQRFLVVVEPGRKT